MKRFLSIFVMCAALFPSAAFAQVGPFSIGGMIGLDEKRLEVAPSVSFGMAIYTCQPPAEGFEGNGLTGLFSSALGQYPAANKGLWVKAQVDPFGIKTLMGIDRAKVANPRIDRHEDWEPIAHESDGTYTDTRRLAKVGVIPFVYRLRHRDGRDKYQLLIITATWTRGGNLPAKLELMVRPEIPQCASMAPKELLTYLNGFVPAYGPIQGGSTQTTNQTIPGQTATGTANPIQGNGGSPQGNGQENRTIPPFGVTVTARQLNEVVTNDSAFTITGLKPVPEPAGKTSTETETTLTVDSSKTSVVLRFESNRPFTGTIRYRGGEMPAKVERLNGQYVCVVYGKTKNYLSKEVVVIVSQDGQTRTIKFTE